MNIQNSAIVQDAELVNKQLAAHNAVRDAALREEATPPLHEQIAAFEELKQALITENSKLAELNSVKNKQIATLSALQTELNELASKTKLSIETNANLAIDDFVKFRTQETEIKAKIEYFSLAIEEIDLNIEDQSEIVFDLKKDYLTQRKDIAFESGKARLQEFAERHKAELNEILQLLAFKLTVRESIYGKEDDHRPEFIFTICQQAANFENKAIIEPYLLPSLDLAEDFIRKSPTRKHRERFEHKEKGFQRLISEINA